MTTLARPAVGDQFIKRDALPWTDAKGLPHVHVRTVLCEVTKTDRIGFDATVVEQVAEWDAPPATVAFRATGTSMAWFGWDAAAARGDLRFPAVAL